MAGGVGINLAGLGLVAGGAVLMYSAVNDPVGGPVAVVRDVLQGRTPTPGVQIVTSPVGPIDGKGTFDDFSGGSGSGGSPSAIVPAGSRGQIVQVARSYLGVPYRFGGASRSGIDCSGLVLVAYRDGAGISLPHLATAQAARGRRITRAECLPGDLVAWGVPGNYPHIALALSQDQVIAAPTWGKPVQIQALWEAKVSGFGLPDIIRILA